MAGLHEPSSIIAGQYTVHSEIGSGGGGIVYRCTHHASGDPVAVKVFTGHNQSTSIELQALSRLRHPNIVQLRDYFIFQDLSYMVMEMVNGSDLRDAMHAAGTPGDPEHRDRIRLLVPQILSALDYLHCRGVVHGDLKPQNILVDHTGRIKITDFGLSNINADMRSTVRDQGFAGTVQFASPEQCKGAVPDVRSDLYSLGVVLYEMYTGRLPLQSTTFYNMLLKQIQERPPSLRIHGSGILASEESTIMLLLEKNPAHRPYSAREVFGMLTREWPGEVIEQFKSRDMQPVRLQRSAFAGRTHELQQLAAAMTALDGTCSAARVITGENGIGKSRLLEEFDLLYSWKDAVFIPLNAAPGRLLEQWLAPAVQRIVRQIEGSATRESVRNGVNGALGGVPGGESLVDPECPAGSLTEAFAAVLRNLTRSSRMVILIDRIGELEPFEIGFLQQVLPGLTNMLIVAAAEDETLEDSDQVRTTLWYPLIQKLDPDPKMMKISALPDKAMTLLVQSVLGTTQVPEELLTQVNEYCGGNPALAQEIIRNAVESGAVTRGESGWQFDTSKWEYRQGDFKDSLLKRVKNLSPDAIRFIRISAVAAPVAAIHPIRSVSGISDSKLVGVFEELAAAGLMSHAAGEIRFRHHVLREILVHDISKRERQSWHEGIAAILSEDPSAPAEYCAYHLARTRSPHRAVPYYEKSVDRLCRQSRFREVIDLAEQAVTLDSCPEHAAELARIWKSLGLAYRAVGRQDPARRAYEKALKTAEITGDKGLQIEVHFGLAGILYSTGKNAEALASFQEAARLSGREKQVHLEARCRLGTGVCLMAMDRLDDAYGEARKALEIYRSLENTSGTARAWQLLSDIQHNRGLYRESQEYIEQARSLFNQEGHTAQEAACLGQLGIIHMDQGRLDSSRELLERTIQLASRSRQPVVEIMARLNLGKLLVDKGEPVRAMQILETATERVNQVGFPSAMVFGLRCMAYAREVLGEVTAAEEQLREALRICRLMNDQRGESEILLAIADARFRRGRFSEALTLASQVLENTTATHNKVQEATVCRLLGQIAGIQNERTLATEYLQRAVRINRRLGRVHEWGHATCEQGFIELDSGKSSAAETSFQSALEKIEACGIIGIRLRIMRGQWEIARKNGDWDRCGDIHDQVQQILAETDEHSVIPNLFFRVDPSPLIRRNCFCGERGLAIAEGIIDSPVYSGTPFAAFAMTTLGAVAENRQERRRQYGNAYKGFQTLNLDAFALQIKPWTQPEELPVKTTPEGIRKTGEKEIHMTANQITPIRFLLRSSREIFNAGDLQRLLRAVMDQVIDATGAERGFLMDTDSQGRLQYRISRNLRQEDINNPEFETSRSIIDSVFASRQAFLSDNVGEEADFRSQKSVRDLRLRSILCVPIQKYAETNAPMGIIYVDNSFSKGQFEATDKLIVEIVAELAAIAMDTVRDREEMTRTHRKLSEENTRLKEELGKRYRFKSLIGQSRSMQDIKEMIQRVADTGASILITGETGTGKEVVARTLHFNSSRKKQSFVGINCAALPENLLEAELFGIEKGVATGVDARQGLIQKADGGTLFLDEIADMSLAIQAKLLRVLQEREVIPIGGRKPKKVDIRLIAATNRDLKAEMESGRFRQDLYYRMNVIQLHMPPLRERPEDIPPLADHFLKRHSEALNREFTGFLPETLAVMAAHDWPGNVRELENVIQRAAILETGAAISLNALPRDMNSRQSVSGTHPTGFDGYDIQGLDLKQNMDMLERIMVERALSQSAGVKKDAAGLLGISARALSYYLKKHDLT